jgi:hypothetical protein
MPDLDDDAIETKQVIDSAIRELQAMNLDLPFGIKLTPNYTSVNYGTSLLGGVLVGNETLAFFITRNSIVNKLHVSQYEPTLKKLCEILSNPMKIAECLECEKVWQEKRLVLRAEREAKEKISE